MFDELLTEISAEMHPFRQQIADREQVRVALALARQKRIAAANARIERRFMEGIGEVVMTLDADLYHRFALIYGYETVNSADFVRTLLRDNPELRMKSRADRLTLRIACTDWKDSEVGGRRSEVGNAQSAGVCTEAGAIEEGELEETLVLPAGGHAMQGDPAGRGDVLHKTAPAGEEEAAA